MGERLLCKQEVVGSIPSASTIIAWSFAPRERRVWFFDIVHRKRSESLNIPRSVRLGRVEGMGNEAVCVAGVVPCMERAELTIAGSSFR